MRVIDVSDKNVIVISDTHIGALAVDQDQLIRLIDRYDLVVLAGDIFDMWDISIDDVKGSRLYEWIINNADRVLYIVGNHDADLWQEDVPFKLYSSIILKAGSKTILVTHGHLFDPVHKLSAPTWLSKFLHTVEVILNRIFGVVWQRVIFVEKKMFTRIGEWIRDKKIPVQRIRAERYRSAVGADFMVHGHTHKPEAYRNIYDIGSLPVTGTYAIIIKGALRVLKWV